MAWLWLTHPAALALLWWLPGWAARRDAARFNAAPADDDLHTVFHRQRLLERAGIFAAVALLASLPCMGSWKLIVVSCGGLLAFGAGAWAYRFNPLLNVVRGLPYVPKYYVSPDPRAALFPDRWIWNRAMRAYPMRDGEYNPTAPVNRQSYATATLRHLLLACLITGGLIYAAAVAGLLLL